MTSPSQSGVAGQPEERATPALAASVPAADTVAATARVALCRDGAPLVNPTQSAVKEAIASHQGLVWIDAQGQPDQTLPLLEPLVHLPGIVREGLTDPIERSRILESAGIYAVVMHGLGFNRATEEPTVSKLDIIFGPSFLITAHRERAEWLDTVWRETIKTTGDECLMARGLPYLLHTIIDSLVDTYFPVLDDLDDVIDELEVSVVNDTSNRVQQRLFHLKRTVATLRRVTLPQAEVMSSIIMRTGDLIPTEAEPYFADVRDHAVRVYEMLDSYRDLLSGLLDVYLSTVSNRLNTVMKQLAIIATIFMPITFVTGVFGQNFGVMPQVISDHGLNFWIVLAFMALITGVQIWYFRRRGWL